MAKISTYPQPTPPQLGDYVIGTDISDLLMTKNYLISDIITLATTTGQFVIPIKGYFYNTASQFLPVSPLNVGVPISFPTTVSQSTNGISMVTDGTNLNRITFSESGSYRFSANINILNTVSTGVTINVWLRKNGVDIPFTNRIFASSSTIVYSNLAVNYAVSVNNTDYIEVILSSSNSSVLIQSEPSNVNKPATPSSVVIINKI